MKTPRRSVLFDSWPRLATRHPWRVVAGSIVALAILFSAAKFIGGSFSDAFSIPNSEAQRAFDLLKQRFPQGAGDSATVVIKTASPFTEPSVRDRVEALIDQLKALPDVIGVTSPYDSDHAISPDGTIGRIDVQYDVRASDVSQKSARALIDLRDRVAARDFQVEAGGQIAVRADRPSFGLSELVGVGFAIVILLIAFGSVVAMGLPILTAILALASGTSLILIGARFADLPSFTSSFAAMIGLGVGTDYALLIVTRYREGLANGLSVDDAVTNASATAGRSVLFAGLTVVIAMLGLWVVGIPFVAYLGSAAAVVVLMAVVVALVVLPAVLRLLGHRIDSLRVPGLKPVIAQSNSGWGYSLSRSIQRRPLLFAAVALGLLLVMAAPLLKLDVGSSDAGTSPEKLTTRRAYDLLSQGFGPGFNGPLLIALSFSNPTAADDTAKLVDELRVIKGVQGVSEARFNPERSAAIILVTPTTAPQDHRTQELVHKVRSAVRASADDGTKGYVGGSTASFIDIGDKVDSRLPFFFGAVIGLSFLLLCVVFRSVLIAIKAALMNVLAIGASFGVLVAVFQWGWLGGLLGVKAGPIESFLPMFMFAVLFGLSMDYEVFLVGRIQEEYLRLHDNSEAVARGLSITSRLITASAAIMVAVFFSFALGDQRIIKEFGIGLASAILIDATLVRLILVPALMQLMGEANWWFPSSLDRLLPHFHLEPGHDLVPSAPAQP